MARQYLRLTFYGRDEVLNFAIGKVDADLIVKGVKALSAGGKEIQAFYLFAISDSLSALISVHELQTVQLTSKPNGDDWKPPLLKHGVAFYLKGAKRPLELDYSGRGPLDDMFRGLADTRYGEEVPGCIMLSDGTGEPSFFRLDEIQYAIVRTELIQRPS